MDPVVHTIANVKPTEVSGAMTLEHPKVLVSYSHDSASHEQKVLAFSEQLRADGIDSRIDQYSPWPSEGWPRWMERQIREADFVLMVCTETYRRRVTGEEEPGAGKGVCWEANLVYSDLYQTKQQTGKYIPIMFEGSNEQHIPSVLQGHSHHCVDIPSGYEDLYRRLTHQPKATPGQLGQLRRLPSLGAMDNRAADTLASPLTPARNAHQFFISDPQGDADQQNFARFLHQALTGAGHEAFIDLGVIGGADWVEVIRRYIAWCDALVVLLSESAMGNEMILAEVRLAEVHQGRTGRPKIIPVRLGDSGLLDYELNLYLRRLPFITWRQETDSQRVYEAIIESVATEVGETLGEHRASNANSAEVEPALLGDRPRAARDPRSAAIPGGVIRFNDAYYIERTPDRIVVALAAASGHTIIIKGPRQSGKSSVLLHYLAESRDAGKKIAFIDFQIFANDDLANYPRFLSSFARVLLSRLRIDLEPPEIRSQFEMVELIERHVLPAVDDPVVFAFDEVDRLLGQPYQADFFSMLRLWHNNRSPFTPEWEDVDLAMAISTEPYLLIDQIDRSPFNVGLQIEMDPFNQAECTELDRRYPGVLNPEERDELWKLLQGHPYLTRLAYYRLTVPDRVAFRDLIEHAHEERGPFGDHLRALFVKLHERPKLLDAMKQAIRTGSLPDQELYHRLYGAGLVRQEGDRVDPANLLYARYFRNAL